MLYMPLKSFKMPYFLLDFSIENGRSQFTSKLELDLPYLSNEVNFGDLQFFKKIEKFKTWGLIFRALAKDLSTMEYLVNADIFFIDKDEAIKFKLMHSDLLQPVRHW